MRIVHIAQYLSFSLQTFNNSCIVTHARFGVDGLEFSAQMHKDHHHHHHHHQHCMGCWRDFSQALGLCVFGRDAHGGGWRRIVGFGYNAMRSLRTIVIDSKELKRSIFSAVDQHILIRSFTEDQSVCYPKRNTHTHVIQCE